MVDLASWFPDSVDLADLADLAMWLISSGWASLLICRIRAIWLDWSVCAIRLIAVNIGVYGGCVWAGGYARFSACPNDVSETDDELG